jgi:hypothetical protein
MSVSTAVRKAVLKHNVADVSFSLFFYGQQSPP